MANSRAPWRLPAESALLGLIVGLAVVLPWTHGGYLLLLDWVSGPTQNINAGVYGLSGSSLDAVPFRIATQALRGVVGPAVTAWILVLAYFPLAAAGVSGLVDGSRWRRNTAALAMVCNPFVVDRVRAGHVAFLLGVALLPWLMRSALNARVHRRWIAVRPAAWFALGMAVSPHVFWLGGTVLLCVMLLPRPTWRDAVRTLQIGLSAGLVYAYGAALYVSGVHTLKVTEADLGAYATVAGPGGLLATLLSLHGFWRDFDDQVRTSVPPVLAVAGLVGMLVLVAIGATRMLARRLPVGRPTIALTVVGLVLASGMSGPFSGLYTFLFTHLPLFEVMREQQKWLALTMMGFAVSTGFAVDWMVRELPAIARDLLDVDRRHGSAIRVRRGVLAVAAIAAAIPLVSAPALFWGLGGTVSVSQYPEGWYAADRTIGTGDDLALFLPWHGYQPFDFTDGRSVATPADAFFRRRVLSSDAVELGPLRTDSTSLRTAYVDQLIARGGGHDFGRMVAPLGVRYVVLAHGSEDPAYSWVAQQPDLTRVLSTPSVDVYLVVPSGTGRVVARRAVPDIASAEVLAAAGRLGSEAVMTTGGDDGSLPSTASGRLHRIDATSWQVDAGTPGYVVVPEEWASGWRADDGTVGEPTLAGTVAVRVPADAVVVAYGPWTWIRLGILLSLLTLVGLFVLGLVEHRAEIYALLRGRHERESAPARE